MEEIPSDRESNEPKPNRLPTLTIRSGRMLQDNSPANGQHENSSVKDRHTNATNTPHPGFSRRPNEGRFDSVISDSTGQHENSSVKDVHTNATNTPHPGLSRRPNEGRFDSVISDSTGLATLRNMPLQSIDVNKGGYFGQSFGSGPALAFGSCMTDSLLENSDCSEESSDDSSDESSDTSSETREEKKKRKPKRTKKGDSKRKKSAPKRGSKKLKK